MQKVTSSDNKSLMLQCFGTIFFLLIASAAVNADYMACYDDGKPCRTYTDADQLCNESTASSYHSCVCGAINLYASSVMPHFCSPPLSG